MRFSQSIHLNPKTREGMEILSVLLAVPPYQRGILLRTILFEHIRSAAHNRYPGVNPKTNEEIQEILVKRPSGRSRRIQPVPRAASPGLFSSIPAPQEVPADLDIDARLDQLNF